MKEQRTSPANRLKAEIFTPSAVKPVVVLRMVTRRPIVAFFRVTKYARFHTLSPEANRSD